MAKIKDRGYRRSLLRLRKSDEALFKRQTEDELDPFLKHGEHGLLTPPYNIALLYKIFEENDVLMECVDAMVQNVAGFGYQMEFLGDDISERESPEAKSQLETAINFFDRINEEQSYVSMCKEAKKDFEITGNSAIEVLRNKIGEIIMMYAIPVRRLRMTAVGSKTQTVDIKLKRNGRDVVIKIKKKFRKFAQTLSSTGKRLRWFKEFGDTRVMDATTGEFVKNGERPKMVASELLWRKNAFGDMSYGLPRWIGTILDAIGRRQANFVNYDLFENQGIPPMAIMVSGGVLTDETLEDIEALLRSARGVEKWNRMLILEATPESMGMEDKGNAKIELKNLSEFRKEDLMFGNYIMATAKHIREAFRLPVLYIGGGETTLTFASAKAAQTVAEEQVFIPHRKEENEIVNLKILQDEFGIDLWKFKLKGPEIVGAAELNKGVDTFIKAGALSVNQSIKLANRLFGTEISEFKDKEWANLPLIVIMEVLKRGGGLKGLEGISLPIKPIKPEVLPAVLENKQDIIQTTLSVVEKLDQFSNDDKALYTKLLQIQKLIEPIDPAVLETQGDL